MGMDLEKIKLEARISLLSNKGSSPRIVAKLKRKLRSLQNSQV